MQEEEEEEEEVQEEATQPSSQTKKREVGQHQHYIGISISFVWFDSDFFLLCLGPQDIHFKALGMNKIGTPRPFLVLSKCHTIPIK